ncbi:MAG: nuclease A inhibitor family protein [Cyanobacteria bacterium P01_D01_bin.50]
MLHNILKYSNVISFYNDYKHLPREGGFFGEDCQEYKDNFFDRDRNIQKLSNIVKTRFKDIKIYWIGDGLIDVYIVGKIETGDWIGIRTRLLHIY